MPSKLSPVVNPQVVAVMVPGPSACHLQGRVMLEKMNQCSRSGAVQGHANASHAALSGYAGAGEGGAAARPEGKSGF